METRSDSQSLGHPPKGWGTRLGLHSIDPHPFAKARKDGPPSDEILSTKTTGRRVGHPPSAIQQLLQGSNSRHSPDHPSSGLPFCRPTSANSCALLRIRRRAKLGVLPYPYLLSSLDRSVPAVASASGRSSRSESRRRNGNEQAHGQLTDEDYRPT